MSKSLTLCFILLFSIQALKTVAQSVTLGNPYPSVEGRRYYFTSNNEILAVKVKEESVVIQKINAADLTLQKATEYNDFPDGYQIELVTKFRDHYYVFYELVEHKKEQLFCREIDFASGTFIGDTKKIITEDGMIIGRDEIKKQMMMRQVDKFDFYFSSDSSKLFIQYILKQTKQDKNLNTEPIHVYDSQLTELWADNIKMPYAENEMSIISYTIDSNNNVYIVIENKSDHATPKNRFEIIKVNSGSMTSTRVAIDKILTTLKLYEMGDGQMLCAGHSTKGNDMRNANEIVISKLDPEGKLVETNAYEIPGAIISQYTGAKNKPNDKQVETEFEGLRLKKVIIQPDGSIIIIGEQRDSKSTYSSGITTIQTLLNDLLITKISASGKLLWMQRIPKRQLVIGKDFAPYLHHQDNKNQHFIFLDSEANLNLTFKDEPVYGSHRFLHCYTINEETGVLSHRTLLDIANVKGMELYKVAENRMLDIDANTFILEAFKKNKEDIMAKVVLSDPK